MSRQRAITEREVRRASREGAKIIDVRDAIVTPGAQAAARELGILLAGPDLPTPVVPMRAYGSGTPAAAGALRIAIGADHAGSALKETIEARLYELGHQLLDLGTSGSASVDYPDYARAVAEEVATGRAQLGIMIDAVGIGSCIVANKVRGVRAAMCHDVTTAVTAREHHDANVLTLGGGLLGPRLALAIVETFLGKAFAGGKHAARVQKIRDLDA